MKMAWLGMSCFSLGVILVGCGGGNTPAQGETTEASASAATSAAPAPTPPAENAAATATATATATSVSAATATSSASPPKGDACKTASDCHGALPKICRAPTGCAKWACENSVCVIR